MKYISLFSGIESASAAWEPLGWNPVCFAEIEPFPRAVLAHRFPNVPLHDDMRQVDWHQYRDQADVVVAGAPCQAFSVAGARQSLDDDRGNLTLATLEAINAIRPEFFLFENVPGILSVKDNAFGCFLAGLVGADAPLQPPGRCRWTDAGLVSGPDRRVAWRILDAQHFGVPQRRRRVFIVGCPRTGADPAEILFEPKSLHRHPAPSRKAREETAADAIPSVASTLGGGSGTRGWSTDTERMTFLPVGFHSNLGSRGGDVHKDKSPPVRVGHTTSNSGHPPAGCVNAREDPISISGKSLPLGAKDTGHVMVYDPSVRRLTPTECERLQGFSDGWTQVPYRNKPAADGPRYKALGNAMAVPLIRWLGERIGAQYER